MRTRGAIVLVMLFGLACAGGAAERHPAWLVSPDDARAVAARLVAVRADSKEGAFEAWKDAKVSSGQVYLDAAGDPAAYCFQVMGGSAAAGYVIISARRYSEPVQEFSRGPAPHIRFIDACRRAAEKSLGQGKKVGKPAFLYFGSGAYFASFPVEEPATPGERVLVAMSTGAIVTGADLPRGEQRPEKLAITHALWDTLLGNRPGQSGAPPEFRYLANVPLGPVSDSGDAAALAALFGYWSIRSAGETDPHLNSDAASALEKSKKDMALEVAKARGTEMVLVRKGRNAGDPASRADFTQCRMELDSGRPFLISPAGAALSPWMPAAGYAADETGRYVIVHDLARRGGPGEGDAKTAAWARVGVVFVNWSGDGSLEMLTGGPAARVTASN